MRCQENNIINSMMTHQPSSCRLSSFEDRLLLISFRVLRKALKNTVTLPRGLLLVAMPAASCIRTIIIILTIFRRLDPIIIQKK